MKSPFSVISFFITVRCNYKCSYCYLPDPFCSGKEIKPQKILAKLAKITSSLDLLGGEPFLEKEKLIDIIQYSKIYGLKLRSISTNGSIYDKEIINNLKTLKDFTLQVSMDAASPKTYKLIRNSSHFQEVIGNTREFIKAELDVILGMVLTNKNYQEIEDFLKLAEELGAKGISFGAFIPVGRGSKRATWCLNYEQTRYSYQIIKNLKTKLKIVGFEDQECPAGVAQVDILPNGDIYPCALFFGFEQSKIGNILDKDLDFSNPWYQELVNFQVPKKCKNCPIPPVCYGGCKAAIYAQHLKFPEKPEFFCLNKKLYEE